MRLSDTRVSAAVRVATRPAVTTPEVQVNPPGRSGRAGPDPPRPDRPVPSRIGSRRAAWHKAMARRAEKYADAVVVPTHAVADDVAYNHHDLHDGLRAGLFTEIDLAELPLIGPAFAEVDRLHPALDPMRRRHEALRRVFGVMVEDVIAVAQNRLAGLQPQSAQEIRDMDGPIIRFSKPLYQNIKAIKSFLFTRMYRAPSVVVERTTVTAMLNDLFPLYLHDPSQMPEQWCRIAREADDETQCARIVLDYVAGMTDRFAIAEHQRLFSVG